MKEDIQNLGDAHSKVKLEAEHIQRMDISECEHIGGSLLDDSGIASITILNKKVTVHASDVDPNGSDFSSHSFCEEEEVVERVVDSVDVLVFDEGGSTEERDPVLGFEECNGALS